MMRKLYVNFIKTKIFKFIVVFLFGLFVFDFIMYVWFKFTVFDLFGGIESHLITEEEVCKSVLDSMLKEKVVLSQKFESKHDVNVPLGWTDDFYPLSKETRNVTISFACCAVLWGVGVFLKYHGY